MKRKKQVEVNNILNNMDYFSTRKTGHKIPEKCSRSIVTSLVNGSSNLSLNSKILEGGQEEADGMSFIK